MRYAGHNKQSRHDSSINQPRVRQSRPPTLPRPPMLIRVPSSFSCFPSLIKVTRASFMSVISESAVSGENAIPRSEYYQDEGGGMKDEG